MAGLVVNALAFRQCGQDSIPASALALNFACGSLVVLVGVLSYIPVSSCNIRRKRSSNERERQTERDSLVRISKKK